MAAEREFGERRAPYGPVSAFEQFLDRIRDRSVPDVVDQRFLRKLDVASNNEYALLSALKFLGIADARGKPTTSYRALQSGRSRDTLRRLLEQAYAPAFESGATSMSEAELSDYFKRASSPSQGRNAARFFRALCRLSGITEAAGTTAAPAAATSNDKSQNKKQILGTPSTRTDLLLEAKSRLLEKLPDPRPDWSAADYQAIYDRFLAMLESLDRSAR